MYHNNYYAILMLIIIVFSYTSSCVGLLNEFGCEKVCVCVCACVCVCMCMCIIMFVDGLLPSNHCRRPWQIILKNYYSKIPSYYSDSLIASSLI